MQSHPPATTTLIFGIERMMATSSVPWWVGPSQPTSIAAVRAGDFHIEVCIADKTANLLAGTQRGECSVGAGNRDQPGGRQPGCTDQHILFCDAEIDMALREPPGEVKCVQRRRDIRIQNDDGWILLPKLNQAAPKACRCIIFGRSLMRSLPASARSAPALPVPYWVLCRARRIGFP